MGAEALCRGAAFVVGIEQSDRACAVIRQNWQQVARSSQRFQVFRGDILNQMKRLHGQEFDCIYFDPPYRSDLYRPVLAAIAQHNLLAPNAELAVEHRLNRPTIVPPDLLEICRQKTYGNTALTFYRRIRDRDPESIDRESESIDARMDAT